MSLVDRCLEVNIKFDKQTHTQTHTLGLLHNLFFFFFYRKQKQNNSNSSANHTALKNSVLLYFTLKLFTVAMVTLSVLLNLSLNQRRLSAMTQTPAFSSRLVLISHMTQLPAVNTKHR